MHFPKVAIIGAGLQGASLAFAISSRGVEVTLIERNAEPMSATALRGEGKIHLGFIYALDSSGATQQSMLEGALAFGPLLESWCGPIHWPEMRSAHFRYAVMPDSIVSVDQLEAAYESLKSHLLREPLSKAENPSYLGEPLTWFWQKSRDQCGMPRVPGCWLFETQEVSLDSRAFCKLLSQKLKTNPLIHLRCSTNVLEARRQAGSFWLTCQNDQGIREIQADIVLNCAWENRRLLDESVGVGDRWPPENFRVKHQILVRSKGSRNLFPVTMAQGPYGDIVPFGDGVVYLSWYPTGRTYFSSQPPPSSELNNRSRALQIARESLEIMSGLFPELEGAEILSSLPGIIVANATTDVDDVQSGLHRRIEIGARHCDGWWSVNPGKLTTAPIIAQKTLEELEKVW